PLPPRTREALHVDLVAAGFVREIRDEATVRRERRYDLVEVRLEEGKCLLVAERRQDPDVPARVLPPVDVSDVLAVPRPVHRDLLVRRLYAEQRFGALAVGWLLEHVAVDRVRNPLAVRRPDRAVGGSLGEAEPRADVSSEVADPDVALSAARVGHV